MFTQLIPKAPPSTVVPGQRTLDEGAFYYAVTKELHSKSVHMILCVLSVLYYYCCTRSRMKHYSLYENHALRHATAARVILLYTSTKHSQKNYPQTKT